MKVLHALNRDANADFPVNVIRTSRYTKWNFVPLFLLEQLNPRNKFANFYFFCVGILQMIKPISITSGLPTVYMPLLFVLTVEVRPCCVRRPPRLSWLAAHRCRPGHQRGDRGLQPAQGGQHRQCDANADI